MAFMDFAAKDETQLQVLFPFPLGEGRRFCNFVSIGGKFLNFLSEDAARGELNRKLAAHWIFSKLVWINPS